MSSIRYHEECYGYHGGQTDCSIFALHGNTPVGKLDISYHKLNGRKEAYINMIEVLLDFQGQGIARELIRQLVKNVPYEAVNWGLLLDDGAELKKAMDKEFGTSYKPVEAQEEPESLDIYSEGAPMKVSELREMIEHAAWQAVLERAFEQYDEEAGVPGGDEPEPTQQGGTLEEKMGQALVLALQAADEVLRKGGDRAPFVQKAVNLFLDVDANFSDPNAVEEEMLTWMEHELPAMAYRHGYNVRVKNIALNIVHDIISKLKKMNAPLPGSQGLHEQEETADEHFYKVVLPDLAQSVLIWAKKGHTFLKVKLLSLASRFGIDPSDFAEELEQLAIKAWEQGAGSTYDAADRLSGVHSELGVVQAVLDDLNKPKVNPEIPLQESRYQTPNFFTIFR